MIHNFKLYGFLFKYISIWLPTIPFLVIVFLIFNTGLTQKKTTEENLKKIDSVLSKTSELSVDYKLFLENEFKHINEELDSMEERFNNKILLTFTVFTALIALMAFFARYITSEFIKERISERISDSFIENIINKTASKKIDDIVKRAEIKIDEKLATITGKIDKKVESVLDVVDKNIYEVLLKNKESTVEVEQIKKDIEVAINGLINIKHEANYNSNDWHLKALKATYDNELDAAIVFFNKAISLNTDDAELYFYRANIYEEMKDIGSALKDYTTAIEKRPEYIDAFCNRGIAFESLKRFPEAIQDLNEAIRLSNDTDDEDLYCVRGHIHSLNVFKSLDAINDLYKSIEKGRNKPDVYENLLELLIICKRYDELPKLFDDAFKLKTLSNENILALYFYKYIYEVLSEVNTDKTKLEMDNLLRNVTELKDTEFSDIEKWLIEFDELKDEPGKKAEIIEYYDRIKKLIDNG